MEKDKLKESSVTTITLFTQTQNIYSGIIPFISFTLFSHTYTYTHEYQNNKIYGFTGSSFVYPFTISNIQNHKIIIRIPLRQ